MGIQWSISSSGVWDNVPDPDFRFHRHASATGPRLLAACHFRGQGDYPATEIPPDVLSGFHNAVTGSGEHKALQAARDQLATLEASVAALDKHQAELVTKRDDPALLRTKDLPSQLVTIEQQLKAVATKREALAPALATARTQVARAAGAEADLKAKLAGEATQGLQKAALERRKQLFVKLADVAGPVLDALVAAEADIGASLDQRGLVHQLTAGLAAPESAG